MSEVILTRDDAVTIIQINRPQVRNAINGTTARALREAWLAFESDDSARVGILTGDNSAFCAGADLKEIESLVDGVDGPNGPLGMTRLTGTKPMIAAIAGYCVAGGLELACWCDLRIADETAVFGCFERRFGVPLIDGGAVRLPYIVGLGRALEMILTGRAVDAHEAHSWGLANEVVPPGDHLRRALELGHLLAAFPQMAMLNDRSAVYAGLGRPLPEALAQECRLGLATLASGESFAGAQAFTAGKGRGGRQE